MRNYESLFIVHPDVVGDELNAVISKFEKVLGDEKAEIVKLDNWGVRKLAYPIKKVGRGNYVQVLFSANPEVVAEYERRLRIDEQILRFLTVRLEGAFSDDGPASDAKPVLHDEEDDDFDDDEE